MPRLPAAVLRPLIALVLVSLETPSPDIVAGMVQLERYHTGHTQNGTIREPGNYEGRVMHMTVCYAAATSSGTS